jgi:hypothetical protein
MMYSLMDLVHLGFKITLFRRIGSAVHTVGTHTFEEPGVEQITLGRVAQFTEARQAAIASLGAQGSEKVFVE